MMPTIPHAGQFECFRPGRASRQDASAMPRVSGLIVYKLLNKGAASERGARAPAGQARRGVGGGRCPVEPEEMILPQGAHQVGTPVPRQSPISISNVEEAKSAAIPPTQDAMASIARGKSITYCELSALGMYARRTGGAR
jgi:hypothetical protein